MVTKKITLGEMFLGEAVVSGGKYILVVRALRTGPDDGSAWNDEPEAYGPFSSEKEAEDFAREVYQDEYDRAAANDDFSVIKLFDPKAWRLYDL